MESEPTTRDAEAVIDRRATALDTAIARLRALPVLDDRTDDDIVGYDETGAPA